MERSTSSGPSGAEQGRQRRLRGRAVDGILLLDKPSGISSNGALQCAKRAIGARKAGHTGNLDVLANGLLAVCFGEATKLCRYLLDAEKQYRVEMKLGEKTTTGDSEGEVTERHAAVVVNRRQIEEAAAAFRGEIDQIPPMYSAIKHQGQPLYKLARRGIEIERTSRRVTIYSLDIRYLIDDRLGIDVACSKGTYIRTLAADLGDLLRCGAHVSKLRRLKVGPYDVEDAHPLAEVERIANDGLDAVDGLLLPMDGALASFPEIVLTDDAAFYVCRGQAVLVPRAPTSGLLRLYDSKRRFLGVGEVLADGRITPRRLLSGPN